MTVHNSSRKLVSLFTGAGGLDLGLENAGFETVIANELEPYACETLRANQLLPKLNEIEFKAWFHKQLKQKCYSSATSAEVENLKKRIEGGRLRAPRLQSAKILERDIRKITSEELLQAAKAKPGELHLVAGGPPCQPFSRAGKRETMECETGRLFKEFVRIVNDSKPRWFLFENVKGLAQSKTELLYIVCKSCGNSSLVPFEVWECAPETRAKAQCGKCKSVNTEFASRMVRGGSLEIILSEFSAIGYYCHWKILNAVDFGAPQFRERLFIVGSRDNERYVWPLPSHCEPEANNGNQPDLFIPYSPWNTMFDSLWSKGHWRFGKLDPSKALLWVKNVVRPHAEPVTWDIRRPSPTIGAHQSAKLALAPEGVPEEQLKRQQWHVLGKRQGDLPPVEVLHEYLTDLELLQLQTFPSHWYLFGTRMHRAFQIGNAVPLALAEAVGRSILKTK